MVEENKIKTSSESKAPEGDKKIETKKEEKVAQAPIVTPKTETKETKKTKNKLDNKNKKTEAKVDATSLHISTKHAVAICNYIRGKNIDKAMFILEQARTYKKAIPMRGEIPHRKGIMSGRFIIKAAAEFIGLLKSLKANAIANELELEKYVIFAKSNVASRPHRRNGQGRAKRTHVTLKLEMPKKKKVKKSKK